MVGPIDGEICTSCGCVRPTSGGSVPRLLTLTLLLALSSGCHTVSCVELDPVLVGEICRERLKYLFDDSSTCQGQEVIGSCAGEGFTVSCDSYWRMPGNECR